MENYQIAFLGTGSMGGAILSGLLKSGFNPKNIRVTTKSEESAKALSSDFHISAFSVAADPEANRKAAEGADVVLLAVKPAQILEVVSEIAPYLKAGAILISVAAGITTAAISKQAPKNCHVIRAMPNTPAVLGLGVTGISKGESVSDQELAIAIKLFETVGKTLVIPESQINALSTISGSGPAYLFYFAEKLIEAAKKLGFSEAEADLMVKETLLGSSSLLVASELGPEELRRQVTSPNGTTMQAISRFDQAKLDQVIIEATEAALARAIELGSLKS